MTARRIADAARQARCVQAFLLCQQARHRPPLRPAPRATGVGGDTCRPNQQARTAQLREYVSKIVHERLPYLFGSR